jgi:Tol biopolymer transport system component
MTRLVALIAVVTLGTGCAELSAGDQRADWMPRFSPDGRTIAFMRADGDRISVMLMDSDGRNQRELSGANAELASFAWAADGRLAYTDFRDKYGETCWDADHSHCYANAEIYVRSADGRRARRVTWSRALDDEPAWIEGGKRIVFQSNRNCHPRLDRSSSTYADDRLLRCALPEKTFAVDAAGRGPEVAYTGLSSAELPQYGDGSHVFASDKDHNGRTCVDDWLDGRECHWHGELYVRRRGKPPLRLTTTTADEGDPSLSPDGKTIVFTQDGRVALMRIDGSGLRIVTS